MKREMDQAAAKYNADIAQLKRENEQIQKQFEEAKRGAGSQISTVQKQHTALESTLQQREEEKR